MGVTSYDGWRASFIARHLRILRYFRDLLASDQLPVEERDAIARRMRRLAAEIREVEAEADRGLDIRAA